jgi:GntR family histidine utilization transcriptional repressor
MRIPPELELVDVYACSRMTVNKALSGLAASGLITRRRRAGTFVAPARAEEPLLPMRDIRAEVLSIDRAYRFEISSRNIQKMTDPIDARHVGVSVGTRLLTLEVMHFADNLAFTVETEQINLDVMPRAERLHFEQESPGAWLLHNVPFSEVEHSIRAISADAQLAKRLQVGEGTACISITRRMWNGNDLAAYIQLTYPGDRHRFVTRSKSAATFPPR